MDFVGLWAKSGGVLEGFTEAFSWFSVSVCIVWWYVWGFFVGVESHNLQVYLFNLLLYLILLHTKFLMKILTIPILITPTNIMQRTTSFIIKTFHKYVIILFRSKPINPITNKRWWLILGCGLRVLETPLNTNTGVLLFTALLLGTVNCLRFFFNILLSV